MTPLPHFMVEFRITHVHGEHPFFFLENYCSLLLITSHTTFQLDKSFSDCHIEHASCYLKEKCDDAIANFSFGECNF